MDKLTNLMFRQNLSTISRGLCGLTLLLLLLLMPHKNASADEVVQRIFIQIWWDSPSIEVDPSDDPGRIEIFVGKTFVGCAIAPSHMNYRKQLMVVPPSLGFTAAGEASAVRILVTGQLDTLPGRQVKITRIGADG